MCSTDFSQTELSRDDLRTLRELSKRNLPRSRRGDLFRHGFAEVYRVSPTPNVFPVSTDDMCITSRGADYLRYLRKDRRRYRVPVVISVISLVVSVLSLAVSIILH